MSKKPAATQAAPRDIKAAASKEVREDFVLRLYVEGQSPKSLTAIANLKKICDEHLAGRSQTEVIDLLENPQRAREDQIVAIPTLIRMQPLPVHKIIGDLSHTERVLIALDLLARP
jgi:circadian clock protein KaiB